MILVVGATGLTGVEICRRLTARGLPVRAFARPTSTRLDELQAMGAEPFRGDLRNPDDVARACEGVTALISTATAMGSPDKTLTLRAIDRDAQLRVVEAAKTAGVERFIYISASPNLPATSPLVRYKREVEAAVRASGMRWTILQPSSFMEIWLGPALGWHAAQARASVFGAGIEPVSWISLKDVAAYAVQAVDDPRLENRTVPIGGPAAVSPNDVVKLFEARAHRPFAVKRAPRPVLAFLGPLVSLFNEGVGSGILLGASTARGDVIDSPVQRDVGLPLTSVEDHVVAALGAPQRA